jgi:hypothetical protein
VILTGDTVVIFSLQKLTIKMAFVCVYSDQNSPVGFQPIMYLSLRENIITLISLY